MIESFRHKGLKRFFDDDDARKLPPEFVERIRVVLSSLHAASALEEMNRPSFRLHPLKGKLSGYWAITVRANWRIIFRFASGKVSDVDLVDYH
jgi:proteic killer suppression protein